MNRPKLMYPEPEATGSGDSPETNETNASVDSFPYSWDNVASDTPADVSSNAETLSEYSIKWHDEDNITDDYRSILTDVFKSGGVAAESASDIIHNLTTGFSTIQRKSFEMADNALREEWGKDFDHKAKTTIGFMKREFDRAGLTDDERNVFMNPSMIRVFNKLMGNYAEHRAVGTQQAPVETRSQKEILADLAHQLVVEKNKPEPDLRRIAQIRREQRKVVGLTLD